MQTKKSPETSSGLKNAKKAFSDTNAVAKPKKKGKPRGKPFTPETAAEVSVPFTGADDPRRNNHGQRNKEAVKTTAQIRNLIVGLFHERKNNPPPVDEEDQTNLEFGLRRYVTKAITEDDFGLENLMNRVYGKSFQPVEVLNPLADLYPDGILTEEQRVAKVMAIIERARKRANDERDGDGDQK